MDLFRARVIPNVVVRDALPRLGKREDSDRRVVRSSDGCDRHSETWSEPLRLDEHMRWDGERGRTW